MSQHVASMGHKLGHLLKIEKLSKEFSDVANPEHAEILKQVMVVWNKWRGISFGLEPDLSNEKLAISVFYAGDLTNVNFSIAHLYLANLGITGVVIEALDTFLRGRKVE